MRLLILVFVLYSIFLGEVLADSNLVSKLSIAQESGKKVYYPKSNFFINGQVLLYNWFLGARDIHNNDIQSLKVDCDVIAHLKIEQSSLSGVLYGANFQVFAPAAKDSIYGKNKALVNQGSDIFFITPYGKFSMGYQQGVESIISRGQGFGDYNKGEDSTLIKYKLNEINDLLNVGIKSCYNTRVIVYPMLYSEGLFYMNHARCMSNKPGISSVHYTFEDGKNFINNLPFRLSYYSPNFMGLKFGFSYSPTGYNKNIFSTKGMFLRNITLKGDSDKVNIKNIKLKTLNIEEGNGEKKEELQLQEQQEVSNNKRGDVVTNHGKAVITGNKSEYIAVYNDNISYMVGAYYNHIISGVASYDFIFNNDLKCQFAISGEYSKGENFHKMSFSDLLSVSISNNIKFFDKLKLYGIYGYLGNSGNLYYNKKNNPFSYYWLVGIGYEYNSLYISSSYFNSRKFNSSVNTMGMFKDFSVGIDYKLHQNNKVSYSIFSYYHHIILNIMNINTAVNDNLIKNNVVLLGVKLIF
ncbi:porin [Candidatus Neoehrlichia procyonis]|uniref:Gram-negative porin family protein n=1 Tax=Candidatus Neoehrlichia procyonis str. RAC413 TaxID=1359163 RepID=A0A0F3NME5_9RICK|nr:porin [Candidatus Neoehrlichia lotoris]KJV68956.1 gram-negative porin family protein [Candidatus Neoehrlichia lotoris str. RAC413]